MAANLIPQRNATVQLPQLAPGDTYQSPIAWDPPMPRDAYQTIVKVPSDHYGVWTSKVVGTQTAAGCTVQFTINQPCAAVNVVVQAWDFGN